MIDQQSFQNRVHGQVLDQSSTPNDIRRGQIVELWHKSAHQHISNCAHGRIVDQTNKQTAHQVDCKMIGNSSSVILYMVKILFT